MELRVLSLYPEQMNIYADRGNIVFLRRRCEWRGIGFQHYGAGPGEHVDPAGHDLFYVGGGQDRDQRMVAADMVASKRQDLAAAVESGAALLAVPACSRSARSSKATATTAPTASRASAATT